MFGGGCGETTQLHDSVLHLQVVEVIACNDQVCGRICISAGKKN